MNKSGNPTYNILLIIVSTLAVLILGGAIFIQFKAIGSFSDSIKQENDLLKKDKIHLNTLQYLKEQYPVFEKSLSVFNMRMPSQPFEDQLMRSINHSAVNSQNDFVQVRFDSRMPLDRYTEMPILVTFQGSYNGFLSLLENVKNGDRLIRIESVKISQGQDNFPQIRAEITARSFFLGVDPEDLKAMQQSGTGTTGRANQVGPAKGQ